VSALRDAARVLFGAKGVPELWPPRLRRDRPAAPALIERSRLGVTNRSGGRALESTYDYFVYRFNDTELRETAEMQESLNEFAVKGWRLVSTASGGEMVFAFFEREEHPRPHAVG
jgi:hypothetical protein